METLTVQKDYSYATKRYELKYIIDRAQHEYLKEALKGHMEVDKYGLTEIASLYYDTPDYRLIRNSIERLDYKEKIRLRSYGRASDRSPVYLELKRKCDGIVYKRRVQTTVLQAERFFASGSDDEAYGQVEKELKYFKNFYRSLVPACLIIYDRTAYFEPEGDLRLTIDENPRYRTTKLDLTAPFDGIPLLNDGECVLEIKVQESMPLWLTRVLGGGRIYKGNFSKYGEAYRKQAAGF